MFLLKQGIAERSDGFTLTELVVVIMIAGILASVVVPRVLDSSDIDLAGAADDVRAALQFARKSAIVSRRYVCVSVSGSVLTLTRDPRPPETVITPSCSQALDLPVNRVGCARNAVCPTSGGALSMTPSTLVFSSGKGSASTAASLSLGGFSLSIDAPTGFVQ